MKEKEEAKGEIALPKLHVRVKLTAKLKAYGEYSFRGENKAELEKAGNEALAVLQEQMKKWEK